MKIELCCPSINSAINAKAAEADRIELCQSLDCGGLTPSHGAIAHCTQQLGIRTHVLIRPREGNFCYNTAELDVIRHDILACKQLGVAAVVIGFLNPDGTVDRQTTQEMVQLAAPMEVTFHRAFDECTDWPTQLETIIQCGCHRVLTSGCSPDAYQGRDNLAQMVRQANGRITILAGCGVTPSNVSAIIAHSHVTEVHGSCKAPQPSGLTETDLNIAKELISNAKK